ncbi:hypothetical protein C8R46DRAFT_1350410, partial [Mycena filopes]
SGLKTRPLDIRRPRLQVSYAYYLRASQNSRREGIRSTWEYSRQAQYIEPAVDCDASELSSELGISGYLLRDTRH